MLKTSSKLLFILGFSIGASLASYPTYLVYAWVVTIAIPNSTDNSTQAQDTRNNLERRLAELQQQKQLVTQRTNRLQTELVSGRQLYRRQATKSSTITYLGNKFDHRDDFLAALHAKWSDLQINQASLRTLEQRQLQFRRELGGLNNKELRSIPALFPVNLKHSRETLEEYLTKTDADIYVNWPSRNTYFIIESQQETEPDRGSVTKFLARSPLRQFMLALPVNAEQRIGDMATKQSAITVKLQQILQHYYFSQHWLADNGQQLWLTRVNLEGDEGISAALLPLELAHLRNQSTPLYSPNPDIKAATYTAVVFDLRTFNVSPGLFPRILTPSGHSVYDVSRTDPNRVIRRGALLYSRSYPTLLSTFGDPVLVVTVQELRGRYSLDWIISEVDAGKILAANDRTGLFYQGRIGALLP